MKDNKDDYEDLELPEIDGIDGAEDENRKEAEMFEELSASLGAQVSEELGETDGKAENKVVSERKKRHRILKGFGIAIGVLVLFALFLIFTPPGRRLGTRIAAKFIHSSMNVEQTTPAPEEENTDNPPKLTIPPLQSEVFTNMSAHRNEDYVVNFLFFGIEEIDGASNTDAMILISLNTKDNSIKLTSFLRDTYVTIPGYRRNKLNSVYAKGGADLLVEVIENTYDCEISGYASVNFNSFEAIIDRLGGIDIELGETEAKYLRRTNYISKKENRTVQAGWNHLNGNQALGYCRVRKVATLGGASNDYGRTLRQRRVLTALVNQFKSASYFDMLSIAQDCLAYVKTNITEDQVADVLYNVIENSMYTVEQMRLPADEYFRDSGKAGIDGITYALVIDDYKEKNIELFHQFVFLDPTPTPTSTPTPSVTESAPTTAP